MSDVTSPDPAELEATCVQALDNETALFSANLQRAFSIGRALTPEEMASIVDSVQRFINYCLSYEPTAAHLANQGFSGFSQRLAALMKDTDDALAVYRTMYEKAVAQRQVLSQQDLHHHLRDIPDRSAYMERQSQQLRRWFTPEMQNYFIEGGPYSEVAPPTTAGEKTEKKPNYAVQAVYFATDRKPDGAAPDKGAPKFGPLRDPSSQLAFGICEVSIPRDHRLGELESPSMCRLEFRADPEKHVTIVGAQLYGSADEFFERIRALALSESSAFVFVHGYNVTFEDAIRRTGQLAYDLSFPGCAIAYSWPSQGKTIAYSIDENNIEWTEPHLEAFLLQLADSGIRSIHIIAHSMGNRAVSRALASLSRAKSAAKFTNVILAAPDIDRDVFLQLASAIASTADLVTLYASDRDEALRASKRINGYPRAGDCMNGIVICDGIVSIDVSAVETDFLGHGYYAANTTIISDLHYLLRGEAPPRFRLQPVTTPTGAYWKFVP